MNRKLQPVEGQKTYNNLLTVENLSYSVNELEIVKDVSFSLQQGEVLGLIGPNGSGKSTLLKCILGFLQPQDGQVHVRNSRLSELSHRERAALISYTAQDGPGELSFSAIEVVEMGAYAGFGRGARSSANDRALAKKALDYVDLGHVAHRHFTHLSGGEQQLVLFARILMQNTPVLLLDEPTSNLDIGHESTLLEMVEELTRENRGAIVAIHNLNLAAEYCSRLILLDKGRIVSHGEPSHVLTKENIEKAYSTRVSISRNQSSGAASVHPVRNYPSAGRRRFHIIGGAGSGINITRLLVRRGIQFTAGIAHRLDSDAELWNSLNIPLVEVEPFSEIDSESFHRAAELCRNADYTILCSFPIGRGNIRNLELAAQAPGLIIMGQGTENAEDSSYMYARQQGQNESQGARSFHVDRAEQLFNELEKKAVWMNYSSLSKFLDSHEDLRFL